MNSRHFSCTLKPITREELRQVVEIAFFDQDRSQVLAISLWQSKEAADVYSRDTYPQVSRH